jgi:NADP-dependent 3-hydroxy acid dehydrogenase YdfG
VGVDGLEAKPDKSGTQEVVMASVLITGASKGIGRATAAEFTRRGHRVIATARDPRTLAGLPADQRLALDVTDPDTIANHGGRNQG